MRPTRALLSTRIEAMVKASPFAASDEQLAAMTDKAEAARREGVAGEDAARAVVAEHMARCEAEAAAKPKRRTRKTSKKTK